MRAFSLATTAAVALGIIACSDPVGPVPCGFEIDGNCWSLLGRADEEVTALAVAPGTIFVGTATRGVLAVDPVTGEVGALGLQVPGTNPGGDGHHTYVSSLVLVPGSPSTLFAGIAPSGNVTTKAAVFRSVVGSTSWQPRDAGLAERFDGRLWSTSLAVSPADPDHMYWGGFGGVLRTTDGGATWETGSVTVEDEAGAFGLGLLGIAISGDGDRVWAAGTTAGFKPWVHWSLDRGSTWSFAVLPNFDAGLTDVLVTGSPEVLVATGVGGFHRSTDAGTTWERVSSNAVFRGIVERNSVLYAAGDRYDPDLDRRVLALVRSADLGRTWTDVAAPRELPAATEIALGTDGDLLLGTFRAGLWRVRTTTRSDGAAERCTTECLRGPEAYGSAKYLA